MAVHSSTQQEKLRDFQSVAAAMVEPGSAESVTPQKEASLAGVFAIAHGAAEKREQTNLLQQVRGGTLEASDLGIRLSGVEAAVFFQQIQSSEAKKASQTHFFLIMLDQLEGSIEALRAEVEAMEQTFKEKYGDSWREKMALKIFGEDEMPQRRDGESMQEFRERLEKEIMNKMLNPDGSIKPEYMDDPEMRSIAEWAQKQWNLNLAEKLAKELNDPETTQERKDEIWTFIKERDDLELNRFIKKHTQDDEPSLTAAAAIEDETRDTTLQEPVSAGGFLNNNGG